MGCGPDSFLSAFVQFTLRLRFCESSLASVPSISSRAILSEFRVYLSCFQNSTRPICRFRPICPTYCTHMHAPPNDSPHFPTKPPRAFCPQVTNFLFAYFSHLKLLYFRDNLYSAKQIKSFACAPRKRRHKVPPDRGVVFWLCSREHFYFSSSTKKGRLRLRLGGRIRRRPYGGCGNKKKAN